ncbi:MAG: PilZ domain-containing protein [Vulcanimicrobiota bacterium]
MLEEVLRLVRGLFLGRRGQFRGEELRQLVRLRCQIPVYLRQGRERCNGWIVDLGWQGLGLRTGRLLKPDQPVMLRALLPPPAGENWIEAEVQWVAPGRNKNEFRAGCRLPKAREPSWIDGVLASLGLDQDSGQNRRRAFRARTDAPLRLIKGDGPVALQMRDLSLTGVAFLSPEVLEPGCQVRLHIGPQRPLAAVSLQAQILSVQPGSDGGWVCSGEWIQAEHTQVKQLGLYLLSALQAK